MLTYKAGGPRGTGSIQRPELEAKQTPPAIAQSKSKLEVPELQKTSSDDRPRGFWSALWNSPVEIATQVAHAAQKKLPTAVCAVMLGAAVLTSGCAGLRGASLDMMPNALPTTTIELASPTGPTAGSTIVAPVQRTDPTELTAAVVRHSEVSSVAADIASKARRGYASSTVFLPGNNLKFQSWVHSYHTGEARQMNILKAPSDGVVRGTIVVNVSGHSSEATDFAKSNTYSVRIQLPDGTIIERSGIPRNVVTEGRLPADTPEYSTVIDVEYLYRSGATEVSAWPDGSGGVGGYVEGRLYYVHSHDAQWDVNKQFQKSRDHKAAHPEIRWGTPHESADLEQHHVSPDPRPYTHYSNR